MNNNKPLQDVSEVVKSKKPQQQDCTICKGTGKMNNKTCSQCGGSGKIRLV